MDYWTGRLLKQWNMSNSTWMRVLFCPLYTSKWLNNISIQNETKGVLDALQSLWDGGQACKRVWQMETAIEEILEFTLPVKSEVHAHLLSAMRISRWVFRFGTPHSMASKREPPAQGSLSIEVGQGWYEWFFEMFSEKEKHSQEGLGWFQCTAWGQWA